MADLTITAANVVVPGRATRKRGTAGAAIAAGEVCYLDAADSKWKLADADATFMDGVTEVAMALNSAAANQPIELAAAGRINAGSAFVAGTSYYLSKNAGKIAPIADITGTGTRVILVGIARSATQIEFRPLFSGVTLA
jgi:hypothetical protein